MTLPLGRALPHPIAGHRVGESDDGDASFDDLYKFGIKEPATALGFAAERVDEQLFSEGILDRIYRQIEVADVVVAEMTGQNPNVFYEVGYAHAKGNLCILSTARAEDIPFGLKHRRHVVHAGSIRTLKDRLVEELSWARREIHNIRKSRIQVRLQDVVGTLRKTKYSASAEINFRVDLLNESDVQPFDHRHFLSPPIRRLYRNGWAQVKFQTKRTLAWRSRERS
jgi:hypothetical protein